MKPIVVDASIALAWCFPDETSAYAETVLVGLGGETMLVPAIWELEVANAIMVGLRRKRLEMPGVEQFLSLIEQLAPMQDARPVVEHMRDVLPLAAEHGLTAYDAAYLELALRRHALLATLDDKLLAAARAAGVVIYRGPDTPRVVS